ncbi:MAG: ATP phosphoribosyltransferase regulatory subunit [Ruminococcaceae bacterium]|nr:ATP phosphoribosyltransferase regulatory subunit [Oscillospiraceae bacterium]
MKVKNYVQNVIPGGTRDLIFEEAIAPRVLGNSLMELYLSTGFKPVETPVTEFYNVFDHGKRDISEDSIFKFNDMTGNGSGRLVALRPDNTSPMLRVATSKLRDEQFPLLLCYSQPIFRNHIAFHAKRDEILQSGVEIIGGDKKEGDLRVMFTALESLRACTAQNGCNFKLEIGHASLFDALLSDYEITESEKENLRAYISAKNSGGYAFELNMTNEYATRLARILPRLCGGIETIDKARALSSNKKASEILDYLESVYNTFCEAGYGDYLMFDLGMVQKINYYTGLVFRGYISGIGEAVLSGGRYDDLARDFGSEESACGFGLNVTSAAELTEKPLPYVKPLSFANGAADVILAKRFVENNCGGGRK